MAAAEDALKGLRAQFRCSICLDYFEEPVIIHCGHNFCRACITRDWERFRDRFPCPLCRAESPEIRLRPNRQLRNAVDLFTEERGAQPRGSRAGDRRCEKHGRRLNLFCEEDDTLICAMCRASQAHGSHSVVPLEEASQGFKEQIQRHLESLEKERDEILSCKSSGENTSQELLKQLETGRQKIVAEFQQLRQFLEEQERLLLAQLEELKKEIEKTWAEYVAKLSEKLSSFSSLIGEMKQKCQQPASEFLQDIKGTLSRCEREKFQNSGAFSSELKWRIWESSQRNASLETRMKEFTDSLLSRQRLDKANVTLDPDTAHPDLTVSADQKTVRLGCKRQALPDNPERFDIAPCVLGCGGFTSDRHYWEVEVEVGVGWGFCAVGVARESVSRKGGMQVNPEQGIWAVLCREDQYQALTSPAQRIRFSPSRGPRRIRVYLDYERGQVSFFDAGTGDPIVTFPPASFAGERICPIFWVSGVGSVRLL